MNPGQLIFFFLFGLLLVVVIQVGALSLAFDKLGLSQHSAMLLLISSFVGSLINLPLFTIRAEASEPQPIPPWLKGMLGRNLPPFEGKTVIAVNLGGCLLPLGFSIYLVQFSQLPLDTVALACLVTTAIGYAFSRPLPGLGIGMPVFVAPLAAALVAIWLAPENSPALAYISGTVGVLVGADLLRLKDIRRMGTPIASIGGAGTFDGIFITGIVAVLLA